MSERDELISLRVNDLGEFVRFSSCGRRFKLAVDNRAEAKALPFAERLFNALDPVLQAVGREAEDHWETALRSRGFRQVQSSTSADSFTWAEFARCVADALPATNLFGREVQIAGAIGSARLSGRMDFVALHWVDGQPRLRVIEGKASRKDRTYHRLQLASYLLLIEAELAVRPVSIGGAMYGSEILEGVVVRIDEATNEPQDAFTLPALNLDTERSDVERMLAPDGILAWLADQPFEDVEFQLDAKCDSCVFSVHCFPESARQRRLQLLGLNPSQCRILSDAGVTTIDSLAELDPTSAAADAIKRTEGFETDLAQLVVRAAARRATLPRGDVDPDGYPVQSLPHAGSGQLPPHETNGQRLVRVYLQVDYDYTQNRIGALAAHVTASEFLLHTPFHAASETVRSRPNPEIIERRPIPDTAPTAFEERHWGPHSGRDVVSCKPAPWTGDFGQDGVAEEELLEGFFRAIVAAINDVAPSPNSPLHFYVFARSEMTQLIEACARTNSRLLNALQELLGCREGLEQLIFSCVQNEVDDRFAFGWTGRGLSVLTSLPWFGARYHWTRRVGHEEVELDRVFEQDIFDFKSTLGVNADGTWADDGEGTAARFEIRSRFHDSLPAPYWRAYWGTLPSPDSAEITDQKIKAALRRYLRASPVGYLEAYLQSRVQALRWLEERVRFKNAELAKPLIDVTALRQFSLGVADAGRAAIDFLRLDHHVKRTDWFASGLRPVSTRVYAGNTIPVRNMRAVGNAGMMVADLDLGPFGLSPETFSPRCDLGEGSYVRISPRSGEPERGQTLGQLRDIGCTAEVTQIDWQFGRITFDLRPFFQADGYVMRSGAPQNSWDFAAVDESVSDFVAKRVETRLRNSLQHHATRWFDPLRPQIPVLPPLQADRLIDAGALLESWRAPHASGEGVLAPDQRAAVVDGLRTRVQLLKGPPGTGKTATTAASLLTRATFQLPANGIVLVAANTHLAVDTILQRVADYLPSFSAALVARGQAAPNVTIARVDPKDPLPAPIQALNSSSCIRFVRDATRQGLLIVGGTTTGLLKFATALEKGAQYSTGFEADLLVVDEASMMVFPHFLALATLTRDAGQLMLAGDNRQLAPIVAHDWETEDRPPVQLYQPFRSSYDAVARIIEEAGLDPAASTQSALTYTFRLPPAIRDLIGLVYARDGIELQGQAASQVADRPDGSDWASVWAGPELVMVVHDERQSRKQNALEGEIIRLLLTAEPGLPADSIAVITPHKAQRQLLKSVLHPDYEATASVIDTVERLQGGERPNIIVSATRSEPYAIGAAASFILNLNRANVAFSRTRARLIVVCAQSLLDHVPPEVEDYETALLWKALRALCRFELLRTEIDGSLVRVLIANP